MNTLIIFNSFYLPIRPRPNKCLQILTPNPPLLYLRRPNLLLPDKLADSVLGQAEFFCHLPDSEETLEIHDNSLFNII